MSNEKTSTLSAEVAAVEVQKLALLRGFPADNPVAVKALIERLQALCTGNRRYRGKQLTADEQCRVLIDETVDRETGWRSPSQLADIFSDLFPNYPTYDANGPVA